MSLPLPPPSPQQPAPDAAPHTAAQIGLAVITTDVVAQLWPSLNLLDLRSSLPAFKAAVALQVQRHAQASASLAARQYKQQRSAAGVVGGFTPVPADPPSVEQIAQTVDWAVQPLWNANVVAHASAGGTAVIEAPAKAPEVAAQAAEASAKAAEAVAPVAEPVETAIPDAGSAIADAKARLAAASERLVLDAGRDTIVENAQRDRKARGWARVPEPGACSFCLMLASRPTLDYTVYKSEQTAGSNRRSGRHKTRAGEEFIGEGKFKVHDHCRCHVKPVFGPYEPTAQVREAAALWISSTRGKSGNAARIAFRQAVEGRTAPGK